MQRPPPSRRTNGGPDVLPWWGWVLVWVVLVVGGAALLAWLGWGVWRKVKLLTKDLGEAERTVAALRAQKRRLEDAAGDAPPELAVFADATELRRRHAEQRADQREERRRRARERRPGWARGVD